MDSQTHIVAKLKHTIKSHTSDVNGVSFNNKTLATCSGDKSIRLWDTDTYNELPSSPLLGHAYYVHSCVFSPFGTVLASTSRDGKLMLWDIKSGEKTAEFQHPSKDSIRICCFSPDSQYIATGGDDHTICIWNLKTKQYVRSLTEHDASVLACAFSPDSNYLITGSSDGDLLVWTTQFSHGKSLAANYDAHDLGVTGCKFCPSYGVAGYNFGQYLIASCGNDNLVKLWSCVSDIGSTHFELKLRDTLSGHTGPVMDCAFTPNGKLLASGSMDKSVIIWDTAKGECLHTIDGHSRYVTCCTFSVDGCYLATGSNDKTVIIWQVIPESELRASPSDEEKLNSPVHVLANDYSHWNMDDVSQWLEQIGLSQYCQSFLQHHIDGTELFTLSQQTLEKGLGVGSLGHRNKILRARSKLHDHPIIQKLEADGTPDEYLCSITREVMKDPVIASDGYTYERKAIQAWIDNQKTRSPMTNALLTNMSLTPNRSLKMIIQRHLQE